VAVLEDFALFSQICAAMARVYNALNQFKDRNKCAKLAEDFVSDLEKNTYRDRDDMYEWRRYESLRLRDLHSD
jgi:hypothetical protein